MLNKDDGDFSSTSSTAAVQTGLVSETPPSSALTSKLLGRGISQQRLRRRSSRQKFNPSSPTDGALLHQDQVLASSSTSSDSQDEFDFDDAATDIGDAVSTCSSRDLDVESDEEIEDGLEVRFFSMIQKDVSN